MEKEILKNLDKRLVPPNQLAVALDARRAREKIFKEILEKRNIPEIGWDDDVIEEFITFLSSLDSNNFTHRNGLGEREARVVCKLVAKRHYYLAHGIGRSGDLLEAQPKAAGSTLMYNLTNSLLLNLLRILGLSNVENCFLVPMATGMTLTLCFLSLKKLKPNAKYVLWSRIDQKACFKAITTAGLEPIIIDPIPTENGLETNIGSFKNKIDELNSSNILCIYSTTSCFANRQCDDIKTLAEISKSHNIYHVVNNAYGLQSNFPINEITQAGKTGEITLFVQSTDKNFMVPVGGAIVAGLQEKFVKNVAKTYVGRASSSQCLDILMTLLSLGKTGYFRYMKERKEAKEYLKAKLENIANRNGDTLVPLRRNPISMAYNLKNYGMFLGDDVTRLGSMLYKRGVSGVRVIGIGEKKVIDGYNFQNWGTHCDLVKEPYLVAAAAIGVTIEEIDTFGIKLEKCLQIIKNSIYEG